MTSSHVLRFPLEEMTGVTIRCKHCGEAFDKALEFFLFKLQTALRESREIEKASIEFELEQ